MWGGLSSAWERANELAVSAKEKMQEASLEAAATSLAGAASAAVGGAANDLWAGAASAAASAADLTASAAASAAEGTAVLALQAKLKGEIKLLQSNVTDWKREWGEESFGAFFAGDLSAVSVSLHRCKAEIDKIEEVIAAKRSRILMNRRLFLHILGRRWDPQHSLSLRSLSRLAPPATLGLARPDFLPACAADTIDARRNACRNSFYRIFDSVRTLRRELDAGGLPHDFRPKRDFSVRDGQPAARSARRRAFRPSHLLVVPRSAPNRRRRSRCLTCAVGAGFH